MPSADLEVLLGTAKTIVIPGVELQELASRSSGPGGQHVNKVSSRVTLRWDALASDALTEEQRERLRKKLASRLTLRGLLVVHAERHRSRTRNRELARERLAELVAGAVAIQRQRIKSRPSRNATKRVKVAKQQHAEKKRDRRPVRQSSDD
jgi:ribosome-associated protein